MATQPWVMPGTELCVTLWAESSDLSDDIARVILQAATDECEEFAPAFTGDPPDRYLVACVMQARDIHRSLVANQDGQVDINGVAVQTWPMARAVKALLRPPRPGWKGLR